MSYPRNAASPPRIEIGAVVQISDGAVQTSGVSVAVRVEGGAETAGGGTVSYGSLSGIVYYTPTQAETDYTAFVVVAYKTGCIPASKSIVTSASATAGYSGVDWGKVIQATTTVNLSGTTISTTQQVASVSGSVGSVTGAVGSVTGAVGSVTGRVTANTDQWGGVTVTGMPMPTYTQPTGFLAATFPATVSSFAGGAVASVTGSVGSIAGVTFPTHFNDLEITANGHVSAVVQSIANNSITASSIQGGAITAAKFAADAITASSLATDAVQEIQSGLATLNNQTTINNNVLSRLASSAYTAPDNSGIAAIKVVTDRVNTGLVQDGAVWQFTVNMLENGPAGAGGGSATLQNQELILDQLDLIQNKTDLITSSGAVTSLLAGAVLEPGTIQGFPTTLKIGDSYTAANGRAIDIPIVDTDGIPLDTAGSLDFSAATVTFTVSRAKETNASRIINGTATVIDPPGTGTANAPYVRVEISSSETAKGLLGYRYTATLKFTWSGTGTDVMSFESSSDIVFDN